MALVSAVGTDTYGGLSGFKRPLSGGNPTRVPANLPAFRGTTNKPGSNVRAPAIKSSANHPDRKTNVCIPYARQVPLQVNADMGRVQAGDLIFVSRDRPGIPGYAHCRFTRLAGVDALNKWMGPNFWYMRTDDTSKFRYISVDNERISDDWRNVPFLAEWTLDGVVLSNEERETFRADGPTAASGQLFNIAIQGPCMMNNGFLDDRGGAQPSRPSMLFAPGYMDHRVERVGQDKTEVDQEWDFQADYRGPQYHLYPTQMFDRNIRPMNELFCGLVAHFVSINIADVPFIKAYAAAEDSLRTALKIARGIEDAPGARAQRQAITSSARTAWKKMNENGGRDRYKKLVVAITAYKSMGWWNEATGSPKVSPTNGEPPKIGFHYFQWVLFTSSHAWELDQSIDIMAPAGEPQATKRVKRDVLGQDPFDDINTRISHFKKMVGAWRIGKVLDMKAAKMPYFEGGPMETGYRVTTDVNLEWWDWRKLRRAFSTNPNASQFCDAYEPLKLEDDVTAPGYNLSLEEHSRVFHWPSSYAPRETETNIPVNPQKFYDGEDDKEDLDTQRRKYGEGDLAAAEVEDFLAEAGFDEAPVGASAGDVHPAMFEDSRLAIAIRASRAGVLPEIPGRASDHDTERHIARVDAALATMQALFASPSQEEINAHLNQLGAQQRAAVSASSIATFVEAASSSAAVAAVVETAAAPASANIAEVVAPTAPVASIRRRAGNTPDPSPDRSGVVMLAAPTAGAATDAAMGGPVNEGRMEEDSASLQPVAEDTSAEPAPVAKATAPRRSRGSAPQADVFSSIFGGAETSSGMQPLNPAHRADGASGGGATGRSFARRGKGAKDKDAQ